MKIYCKLCDKVQLVIIDNCRDAKTNEPFQDIVCKECHLVIAAGTDIQREWIGLTDKELDDLHRILKIRLMGTFEIKDIYRAIEQQLKERNT